jgi:3-hydroxy-3-methylglutaryl CoA synthase
MQILKDIVKRKKGLDIMNFGIISYGVNIPRKRIKVESVQEVWKNTDINLLKSTLRIKERVVLDSDEDNVTLSVESAKQCLEKIDFDANDIESIFLGTSTNPDLSRANSTIIMSMLTDNNNYFSSDVQFSEKSGTCALINGYSYLASGLVKNSLIVATDTVSRHIAPGDLRESYCGAGSGSLMLGSEKVIARIGHIASYNSNFPDEIRPEDERYIRAIMPINRDRMQHGLVKHCLSAIKKIFALSKTTVADYDYFVFQQLTPISPGVIGDALNIPGEKIFPAIFADYTGNVGAASPFIGLSKVLDIAKPGNRILLSSYGTGAGADAIELLVTEAILDYRNNTTILTEDEIMKNIIYVTYPEAIKYEFKYNKPAIALNTYL